MNNRIKEVRLGTKLNQEAFGKRLKITKASISRLESGINHPSDQTISLICSEFNIDEHWLRTGEGEMFMPKSRTDEISAFVGNILQGESDFRQKFISVLARMTPDEWQILEKKVLELAEEIKKADP